MTNSEKQVLLGSILGDGYVNKHGSFHTGSKYKEWVDYKINILQKYNPRYEFVPVNGFAGNSYHRFSTWVHEDIKYLHSLSLKEQLEELDELGLAIWVYDDGSMHHKHLFYNLNTHSFSHEIHETVLAPYFKSKWNITTQILFDKKKDGRIFSYLYIPKKYGAEIINKVLKKIPIECYKYKTYEGNINDTIVVKCIGVTDLRTNKYYIFDNVAEAVKYIGSYSAKIRELAEINGILKDTFLINYHFFE